MVKLSTWRETLERQCSEATYEDLATRIGGRSKPQIKQSKSVPVKDVLVAEKVFQWRGRHSDLQSEERHMRELVRALDMGRELEPILVVSVGTKFYVIDGHHRLAAYAAEGRRSIPVRHFDGGFQAAWLKSLQANIRDKLPMTRQDKQEAAYTLIKRRVAGDLEMTCEEIADLAIVSHRLAYKMQREFKAARLEHDDAHKWSWVKTLQAVQDDKQGAQEYTEEVRDEHARRLADQIMSKVKINLVSNPDITARALRMISEGLPWALIEQWEEEAQEFLLKEARTARSEDAENTLARGFRLLEEARGLIF